MSIDKFLKNYYIFILGVFPAIFYWLIIWTCFDLFWTSFIMVMIYYLLILIFFYKYQDQLINNLIISKIDILFTIEINFKKVILGFIIGIFEFLFLMLLFYKKYPIYLPIPNNIHYFGNIIYVIFLFIFYSLLNEVFNELYYYTFLKALCGFYLALIFDSFLVFFQITFLTQNSLIVSFVLIYNIVKEIILMDNDFNVKMFKRVGNKIGFVVVGSILLIMNNFNLNMIKEHPKNNWKG